MKTQEIENNLKNFTNKNVLFYYKIGVNTISFRGKLDAVYHGDQVYSVFNKDNYINFKLAGVSHVKVKHDDNGNEYLFIVCDCLEGV